MEKLPVIFRKFKEGDLIAFFPTVVDSTNPNECMSYQFIGQHGNASAGLITTLKKCSEDEYDPLLKHLTHIYSHNDEPVELVVVNKSHRKYFNIRLADCKRWLGMK